MSDLLPNSNPETKLFFYSYWCDDVAIGLAMLQRNKTKVQTVCRVHRWDVYFDQSAYGYLPFRYFIASNLTSVFPISEDALYYIQNVWKVKNIQNIRLSRLGISEQIKLSQQKKEIFTMFLSFNEVFRKKKKMSSSNHSYKLWSHPIHRGTL